VCRVVLRVLALEYGLVHIESIYRDS
jgi:hypothetical protein